MKNLFIIFSFMLFTGSVFAQTEEPTTTEKTAVATSNGFYNMILFLRASDEDLKIATSNTTEDDLDLLNKTQNEQDPITNVLFIGKAVIEDNKIMLTFEDLENSSIVKAVKNGNKELSSIVNIKQLYRDATKGSTDKAKKIKTYAESVLGKWEQGILAAETGPNTVIKASQAVQWATWSSILTELIPEYPSMEGIVYELQGRSAPIVKRGSANRSFKVVEKTFDNKLFQENAFLYMYVEEKGDAIIALYEKGLATAKTMGKVACAYLVNGINQNYAAGNMPSALLNKEGIVFLLSNNGLLDYLMATQASETVEVKVARTLGLSLFMELAAASKIPARYQGLSVSLERMKEKVKTFVEKEKEANPIFKEAFEKYQTKEADGTMKFNLEEGMKFLKVKEIL